MKVIYFIGFIAKFSLICFLLTCSAQAQTAGKKYFCYEVYEYSYSDQKKDSHQNFILKDQSFDFLLKLVNALTSLPLDVSFVENQVIFYFWEPCSKTKEGFPGLIKDHNHKFGGKIRLVPSQNYKKEDIECVLAEKFQASCPGGHLTIDKEKKRQMIERLNR